MAAPLRVLGSERVALVGKTGSGKTYLAGRLTAALPRLVVLDPKGTLKGKWRLADWSDSRERQLRRGDPVRVRVPAPLDGDWEPYLWAAYEAGNCTVYVDEVYGVVPAGSRTPAALTALYTRGRELGIGTWAATQRPSWVPLFVLSEAEWLAQFRLSLDADRKRMAGLMGAGAALDNPPDKYGFYLFNQSWHRPAYFSKVSLAKGE